MTVARLAGRWPGVPRAPVLLSLRRDGFPPSAGHPGTSIQEFGRWQGEVYDGVVQVIGPYRVKAAAMPPGSGVADRIHARRQRSPAGRQSCWHCLFISSEVMPALLMRRRHGL